MRIETLIGRLLALEAQLLIAGRPMKYTNAVVLLRSWWVARADEIMRAPEHQRPDLLFAAITSARCLNIPAPAEEPVEQEIELASWAQRVAAYYTEGHRADYQPTID